MKWEHCVDLDWMKERQQCLTASDVIRLIPFTATGRPKKIKEEDYARVLAGKMVKLNEEDCMSYGAAARGHLLEPYAIESLNNYIGGEAFHHWDDLLIESSVCRGRFPLAFSPDACDISMFEWCAGTHAISSIAEVKSYNAEKHYKALTTPKDKLEERWQIATAMATKATIETAYLVFFNPSFEMEDFRIGIFKYKREDLLDEMEEVLKVHMNFNSWVRASFVSECVRPPVKITEEGIVEELVAKHRLNP